MFGFVETLRQLSIQKSTLANILFHAWRTFLSICLPGKNTASSIYDKHFCSLNATKRARNYLRLTRTVVCIVTTGCCMALRLPKQYGNEQSTKFCQGFPEYSAFWAIWWSQVTMTVHALTISTKF
ncbi:hypothetical protein DPMN_136792 [Dreissena polymorpha]|uniref:Uncharacterized protein n=1 Tax=Dreissena polymorpha TaxID=45954 RepID=A0A9D4G491_DREPO|nr:hypothetical protein DPMN_136792 [Dreissena polymorpha]